MSQNTDRLYEAFNSLIAAVADVVAAQDALPDEEYSLDLPSVLICTYEPRQQRGTFTLLGTLEHTAQAFDEAITQPGNMPFRHTLAQVMARRIANRR